MEKNNSKLTKKEYAYNIIKERILDGTYAPGHRVVIDQLSKEIYTSAIPIREAIRQLESENLIEYKQYSGAVVTPIDENQYLEALTVLSVLAAHATALGARHIPKQQIRELKKINERMKIALDDFDFAAFGKLNREFHMLTYSYCDNSYLLEHIQQVHRKLDSIRRTGAAFVPPRARESIREHGRIIELLTENAPFEEIERFVKQHKLNTVESFKKRKTKLTYPTV